MLTVLDLFSGIGGFSLGLERTGGFKTVAFCEIDPFCRKVLAKHWPGVPVHEDITTLRGEDVGPVDVIAGGFPCQDISLAGTGAGLAGDRSGLWRELMRAIRVVRPRYAIVENVAALLGRGLDAVLGDLADTGYDAEWDCVPTCPDLGHRRERVFVVAHFDGAGLAGARQPGSAAQQASPNFAAKLAASGICRSKPPSNLVRNVHGIPQRVDRIAALGNSVRPKAVELVGNAILEAA